MGSDYIRRREFMGKTAKILGLAYVSPSLLFPQEYSEKEIKDFVVNIYKATVHLFPTLPSYNINLDGKKGEENVTVSSNDIGEGKKKIELLLSYYRLENTRSSSGRILVDRKGISITLDGDEATLDKNEFDKNEIKYLPEILKEVRK